MFDTADIENESLTQAIVSLFANPIVLFCTGILLLLVLHFARRRPDWPSLAARLTERAWTVRSAAMLVLTIVLLLLTSRLVVSLSFQMGFAVEQRTLHAVLIAHSLILHAAILLLAAAMAKRQGVSLEASLGLNCLRTAKGAKHAVVAYMASVPIVGMAAVLSSWSLNTVGIPPQPQYVVQLITDTESMTLRIILVVVAVVTAPLAEEVFFRGICMPMLARHFGMVFAVSVISVLFAAVHLHLHSVVPLLAIAIVFAVSYIYSGSIVVPVFVHALFNAVGLIVLFLVGIGHRIGS